MNGREMKAPITQTLEWKKLQDDLGEISFFEQGNGYQYLAILKTTPVGKYLYLPYGPVFEKKQGMENSLKDLSNLARKHQAFFIRIEPQNREFIERLPSNARKSTDLNPKETWLLDLNPETLTEKLPSRLLRYHKSAAKKGLTIEKSRNPEDIHYLLDLQKALARQKGISTFSENYLKTELKQPFATLYLVRQATQGNTPSRSIFSNGPNTERPGPVTTGARERSEKEHLLASPLAGEVIAAGLVFDDRTTRYNLQGAQSDQGRKLHATGILTIELINDAVAAGKKIFDFWGIAPENAPKNHPWAGFTAFKKTFAGSEQDYCGTYDLVLDSKKYRLYQLLRKLNRLIRR